MESKSTQSLTTAEEMRKQTKLLMQPFSNWELYLTPAPLSIAIMGELVFISSKTDFSINKNPPKDGFKFIRYPDSFRACLMQVCNSGWGAFNEAHKSMDQIRLLIMSVPDHMKSIVKILFQHNDEAVQALLPDHQRLVHLSVDSFLILAESAEKRFTDILNIIQELLEACYKTEHFYGEEKKEIKDQNERKKEEDQIKMLHKEQIKSGRNSASERAVVKGRFRIEQSQAQLNKTRETYEKSVENMEKNQKELTEIPISMRNCEIKEIDFNTTIKMLVKGMDAMMRVKEQWEKMVCFFQMVSIIVKINLYSTLKDVISMSEKTQSLSYNGKLFSKDLLYNQAFQASNIASLVHMISATYTDVSDKYLMDPVSSLGKLMSKEMEKTEFLQERLQLQDSCDEAQRGILDLVLKNKEEFEKKTDSRLETISKELLAILPEASPEEMKSIQAVVESGFHKEKEEAAH